MTIFIIQLMSKLHIYPNLVYIIKLSKNIVNHSNITRVHFHIHIILYIPYHYIINLTNATNKHQAIM